MIAGDFFLHMKNILSKIFSDTKKYIDARYFYIPESRNSHVIPSYPQVTHTFVISS